MTRENKFNRRVSDAKDALHELKQELERRTSAAKKQARDEMDVQFTKVMSEIDEAEQLQAEEQKLIDADKIAAASYHPLIGAIFAQWESGYSHLSKTRLSGVTGVCEVATEEHKKLKSRNGGACNTGSLVIRYLRKSGEKGKLYEGFRFNYNNMSVPPPSWYPIGETPEQHR